MDEVQVVTQTLNATLQRHARVVQGYEVEVANMTAEIVRLNAKIEELTANDKKPSVTDS